MTNSKSQIEIKKTKRFIQIKKFLNELNKNYPNVYKRPHIMSNAIIFNGIVFNFISDYDYINIYPLRNPKLLNINLHFENINKFFQKVYEKNIFQLFENHYKGVLNYAGHL